MIFDLFHSVSDPAVGGRLLGSQRVFANFLDQVRLAENLDFDTVWLAESHFSSEIQKSTSVATIPNFSGEVGLNSDSFQWIQYLASQTHRINFGTAIHNILGGSGGPLSSADRVNHLDFMNRYLWETPRTIRLGVAAGRFLYQNTPFGIVPQNELQKDFWPQFRRFYFITALEIFLRLLRGEVLASSDLSPQWIHLADMHGVPPESLAKLSQKYSFPIRVDSPWSFESLKLVPEESDKKRMNVVLGSADPIALETANQFWDVDLFNLSFTPPDQIDILHNKMAKLTVRHQGKWHRSRLPRTVMIFLDRDRKKAHELADFVLDTYIEAMRGTAAVPAKQVLLDRALVGDAAEVRDQLHPENPRRFHADDRLMLWFEFNQQDNQAIGNQMKYFSEEVRARLPC